MLPRGAIYNTNSAGRFDLALLEDGILAVRGTYVGVALRAVGIGAAGSRGWGRAAVAGPAGRAYEETRLSKLLQEHPSTVLAHHAGSHFIAVGSILDLTLRKRWYEHSLTIFTGEHPGGRKYTWKPALNDFHQVRSSLESEFGRVLTVE